MKDTEKTTKNETAKPSSAANVICNMREDKLKRALKSWEDACMRAGICKDDVETKLLEIIDNSTNNINLYR